MVCGAKGCGGCGVTLRTGSVVSRSTDSKSSVASMVSRGVPPDFSASDLCSASKMRLISFYSPRKQRMVFLLHHACVRSEDNRATGGVSLQPAKLHRCLVMIVQNPAERFVLGHLFVRGAQLPSGNRRPLLRLH